MNAGYGFEDIGCRLGQFQFVSNALTHEGEMGERVNRFAGSERENLPVPLPRNYVQGIDVQKHDFESGFRSYLRGEWRTEGWWHYYAYGLLVKTPVGTLMLFAASVVSLILPTVRRIPWRDEFALLLPGAAVFVFVSSQTGFNHHLRYVLPALPFAFVWAGRVVTYSGRLRVWWRVATASAAVAAAASSLAIYPHSLSYFNEPAGGPLRGSEHLVDSNIDWGQDLLHLKAWLDEHPEARPLGLAYFGYIDPRSVGIEFALPAGGSVEETDREGDGALLGPRPGWYAVSVGMLRGLHYAIPDGTGRLSSVTDHRFGYFLRFRPVATAGYSICIYHLDETECARVRAELGLPPLEAAR